MEMENRMALVEGAVAVEVDLADQAARGVTASEEEEGEAEGDGGEGEMETTRRTEEEGGSSLEEAAVVAGEGAEEGVVNARTMGTARREGEEGEEGDSIAIAQKQLEETKMVREMK
jgi:hypothetical protein